MMHQGVPQPIISLQYVSKTFGHSLFDQKTLVLKNVSIDVYENQFIIVFGPSGSGKSTMLNLMAGLETPTIGQVLVRGNNLLHYTPEELSRYHRLKMGMVFQNFNLIKSLNVWENVALPQTADGIHYEQRKQRAFELLERFNLSDRAHRHPNELSGGEQQRVAIARALINDPFVMLVDEPTGNLDSQSAEDVMAIFKELHQNGRTIVLVTHNPNFLHYASWVVHMQDGRIVKVELPPASPVKTTAAPLPEKQYADIAELKDPSLYDQYSYP